MKRPSSLFVSGIVLAAVLFLLFLEYVIPEKKPVRPASQKPVILDRLDQDSIVRVELISAADKIILEKSVLLSTASQTGGTEWHLPQKPFIRINKSAILNILLDFSIVYVDALVEEKPADLEKYGLDPPVVTAKAFLDTGESRTYYLGKRSAAGTWYLMAKDDNKVYSVLMKYGKHFSYSVDDLRDKALLDFSLGELDYLRLSRSDKPDMELVRESSGSSSSAHTWIMTKPYTYSRQTDPESLSVFLKKIVLDSVVRFIDDDPDDLAIFGLSKPQAELELRAGEKRTILLIGEKADTGSHYIKLSESPSVVTVETRKLRFLDVDPFNLTRKTVLDAALTDAAEVRIYLGEISYEIKVEQPDESGQFRFFQDGTAIDEKAFITFFLELSAISLVSEAIPEEGVSSQLSISIQLLEESVIGNNTGLILLNFFPYNSRYMIADIGNDFFLVAKEQIEHITENIYNLISVE